MLTQTDKIRAYNDEFRTTLNARLGKVLLTPDASSADTGALLSRVMAYATFGDNDPYDEHDFGSFEHGGTNYFWKIDYYDPTLESGSDDPADPQQTTRVLTIMSASEY